MRPPLSAYRPSKRRLPSRLPSFEYPATYSVRKVTSAGRFRWPGRHLIRVGAPLAGEYVGCKQIDDALWEVYLGALLLGYVDVTRIDQGLIRL